MQRLKLDFLANPSGFHRSLTDADITAGGQVGYNWQISSSWVVGGEADINWTDIDKTVDASGEPDETPDILRGKVRWFGTLRARVGYAPGAWLLYVTGGASVARLRNDYGDIDDGELDPFDAASVTKTRWGWTVGAGVEYIFSSSWSAKLEYLYLDFGRFNGRPIDDDSPGKVRFKDQMHVARVGVNWHF